MTYYLKTPRTSAHPCSIILYAISYMQAILAYHNEDSIDQQHLRHDIPMERIFMVIKFRLKKLYVYDIL